MKLLATIGGIFFAAALCAKSPAHAPRNVDQKDFEVSDGRIESVAQNRFMVSPERHENQLVRATGGSCQAAL